MEDWLEVAHHTRKDARKDNESLKNRIKSQKYREKKNYRQAWNHAECDTAQIATRQAIKCAWIEARNSFSSVEGFRTGKENK